MASKLMCRLVDAFAERPFRGNVAGVVLGADGLTDEHMQQIAAELNASETAFITRLNDLQRLPRLRWFAPAAEVQFCGHATLAAAHAAVEAGLAGNVLGTRERMLAFESAAGELRLVAEPLETNLGGLIWWLQMPDPRLEPERSNPSKACELLGFAVSELDPAIPPMRTRDGDVIFMIRDWTRLMELRPRFDELRAWSERVGIRGYCVATTNTLSNAINLHSRFFAPAVGINEDPVTGSVHGPLSVLAVLHGLVESGDGRAALMCAQGLPGGRGGIVRALVETQNDTHRVRIGGQCVTTLVGDLILA